MDGQEETESSGAGQQENRAHPRYSVDEDSVLVLVAHGMPVKARIVDLSLEGCRVRTIDRFTAKSGRAIEITFKANGIDFRCNGVVQWTDGNHFLGIHFVNMTNRRKEALAEVIEEMAAAAAARARTADLLAAEQEGSASALAEVSNGVAATPVEPAATKVRAPAIAETATEPSAPPRLEKTEAPAEAPPPVRQLANPHDRRGQARLEVNDLATIFLVKVGSELRGQILDLSLSGCRIRTDEHFPVGIYTRVETEFYLRGLPFKLSGVIQAIHNRNTVGIRFLDLSERKRQEILELIDEIKQGRADTQQTESSSANRETGESDR